MRTRRMSSTFVSSANAVHRDRSFAGSGKISVQSSTGPVVATGGTRYGYIKHATLCPQGATITAATLKLTLRTAVTVDTTLYAERILSDWTTAKTTWNRQPSVYEPVTVSELIPAGTPAGAVITLDITALVAPIVARSLKWKGVRLRASSLVQFHSEDHPTYEMRPQYVVDWSDVPDAPSGLIPSGGLAVGEPTPTLSWDFVDYGGSSTSIEQVHVQISTSSSFAAPVYDSGEQPSAASSWTPEGFVAAAGLTYWWQARHADGDENWSDWSPPASFTYAALPPVTVTSLAGGVFTDPTPTLIADAPDMQQWRVHVALDGERLWTSADGYRSEGSEIRVQVPEGVIRYDERDYTFIFQVWDSVDRVETAGRPTYRVLSVTARFDADGTLAPVTGLSATDFSPVPGVQLQWQRATPADGFVIYRNGTIIARVDAEDVVGVGGVFTYVDNHAEAGTHVYKVRAVENGKSSGTGSGVTVTSKMEARWLILEDGRKLPIFNEDDTGDHGLKLRERVEEIELADGRIAMQTIGLTGFDGSILGVLTDSPEGYPSLTLEEAEALAKEVRLRGAARFAQGDLNFPARITAMNLTRNSPMQARRSAIEFRVTQDGEEDRYGLKGGWR